MNKLKIASGAIIGIALAGSVYVGCSIRNKANFEEKVPISPWIVKHTISRPAGLFGSIMYQQIRSKQETSLDDDTVIINSTFGTRTELADGRGLGPLDGRVDYIETHPKLFGEGRCLLRDKDYKENKKEFDEADGTLAEIKERFKEYF